MLNRIGDPLDKNTLIGPVHSENSLNKYKETIDEIQKQGGSIEIGGKVKILLFLVFEESHMKAMS